MQIIFPVDAYEPQNPANRGFSQGVFQNGKNLKSVIRRRDVPKLYQLEEPNQELQLKILSSLLPVWGTIKYLLTYGDRFSKLDSMQITTRTTATVIRDFLENYIALHVIPRAIRTDQGSGFVAKSKRKICTKNTTS